ncbi:MAG: hypothetical protein JWQ10_4228 [Herbaspirillum sp.]|nr:hypothetical protein [Herbaspirillum sp.]
MWTEIYGLAGSTLATLGRKNLFLIVKVETNAVVVRPLETAVDRRIPRKEIEGAYDELRLRGTMTLAQIRSFSEMNPVYVAAMLSQILGVTYVNKPKIQLSVLVNR